MVRIHYELPDDLHRRVKAAAAMEGLTLKDYLFQVLEEAVSDQGKRKR